MRVFVTGAAGFIGSNYVRYLLHNSDAQITIFDSLTYAGNESTMTDLLATNRVKFIKGDVCDPAIVESSMLGHDRVVHFAAESHVDRSIAGSSIFFHTNCFGTNVIMDAARRCEVDRVVHIGTDEVYGSVELGSSLETDALDPRSPYSASKAGSDLIAGAYFHTYGLPVIITRCTNNFGPFQYPEKAIPLFTTNLLRGHRVPLYGDGLHQRDWLYVDDHCSGIETVMEKGSPGEIYNIGAGNETRNIDLVRMILEILDLDVNRIEHVQDRPGHDRRYSVNTSKIREIGWEKRFSIESALEATVRWYQDNEWWWVPLRQRTSSAHG
jgi:dTDP-glucose 4,6-dehydratase